MKSTRFHYFLFTNIHLFNHILYYMYGCVSVYVCLSYFVLVQKWMLCICIFTFDIIHEYKYRGWKIEIHSVLYCYWQTDEFTSEVFLVFFLCLVNIGRNTLGNEKTPEFCIFFSKLFKLLVNWKWLMLICKLDLLFGISSHIVLFT